jgi:CRP/FNR family transcriptional regulator, cyclic AMP receptor protein
LRAILTQVSEVVHILAEDPDLAAELRNDRLERAIQDCAAPVVRFDPGDWSPPATSDMQSGLGLLLLDGLVVRRVGVGGRVGSELLGEGDLLRPWEDEEPAAPTGQNGRWRVLQGGRLAILDRDFTPRVCRYPEVVSALVGRAVRRSRCLAVTMAILHHPRIDVRLHMLLWELAERWGHVHRDGVHLPLRLTHAMLAELVAARRPTVTKALGELAGHAAVVWTGDHWLLKGGPPSELEAIHSVSITEAGEPRAA